jgi:hypothetical protein
MSIEEHKVVLKAEYTEQTFFLLSNLHKIARNLEIAFDKNLYTRTYSNSLVDPNYFPIITRQSTVEYVSVWNHYSADINPLLLDKVGFRLAVKKSQIPHPEAGSGVYLEAKHKIPAGSLLGFVPGMIYNPTEAAQKMDQEVEKEQELPFLLTYNGEVICFKDKVMYPPFRHGYSYSDYYREIEIRNSKRH